MAKSPNIRPSGAAFSDLQSGGLSRIIELVVAANPTIADPASQITVNVTGGSPTGGTLPAGTYYAVITYSNGAGESTIGTSRSAQFTVAAGNIPRVSCGALPTGASEILLYLTPVGGASGSEVCYSRENTGATIDLAVAAYFDSLATPPIANTTALSNLQSYVGAFRQGRAAMVYKTLADQVSAYVQGDGVPFDEISGKLHSLAAVFKLLSVAADDCVALVDANHGTIANTVVGGNFVKLVRTFP